MRPDVILLGDRLEPDMDVLALVEQVRAAAPRARIVILSYLSDGPIVQELFTVGAMGYLYKNDPLSHYLVEAIQTVGYVSDCAAALGLIQTSSLLPWLPKKGFCPEINADGYYYQIMPMPTVWTNN